MKKKKLRTASLKQNLLVLIKKECSSKIAINIFKEEKQNRVKNWNQQMTNMNFKAIWQKSKQS